MYVLNGMAKQYVPASCASAKEKKWTKIKPRHSSGHKNHEKKLVTSVPKIEGNESSFTFEAKCAQSRPFCLWSWADDVKRPFGWRRTFIASNYSDWISVLPGSFFLLIWGSASERRIYSLIWTIFSRFEWHVSTISHWLQASRPNACCIVSYFSVSWAWALSANPKINWHPTRMHICT